MSSSISFFCPLHSGDIVAVRAAATAACSARQPPGSRSSVTNAPWIRIGLLAPIGRNSASPWPISFSAPAWSRMTRQSVRVEVAKASRDGTLALISPVTTSTDGTLRRQHQVDAGGARHLGDPNDRVLDVAGRDHHQVGELVDDRPGGTGTAVYVRSLPGGACERSVATALRLKSSMCRKPEAARSS